MPLVRYKCECSNAESRFFRHAKEIPLEVVCKKCGKRSKKQLTGPASRSIVTVDNGFQARSTEVNLELVEDIEARSTKDFNKKE